jgi:hypothetical protein
VEHQRQADAQATHPERRLVLGAIAVAALVYSFSLVTSLVVGEPGAPKAALRLALLAAVGFPTIRRVIWARWVLVAFLGVWAVEQAHWAFRDNLFGAVASPIFIACAITLASRPASRYVRGAV